MKYVFEGDAVSQKKYDDNSGETAIWTDGILLSTLDSIQDNFSPIRLIHGKKYRVTIILEEI